MYAPTALNLLICEMLEQHLKCQFTKINKFHECIFEELFYIIGSAGSNGLNLLMIMGNIKKDKSDLHEIPQKMLFGKNVFSTTAWNKNKYDHAFYEMPVLFCFVLFRFWILVIIMGYMQTRV